MPQLKHLLIAALGALSTLPAWAADSGTPSPLTTSFNLASNYVYRGLTRTNSNPAIQGGIDLTASNGVYIGVWGSNVSWLADQGGVKGSSLELDAYLGVKNSFATDFTYDLGVLRYHYPATYNIGTVNADTSEVYGAIGYQWLSAKYSYSMGNAFGMEGSNGTDYVDLSANFPITDSGFTLGAHYGKQSYKGATASLLRAAGTDPSYADYKFYLTYNFNGYVLGFAYTGTTAKNNAFYINAQGNSLGRSTGIFSLNRNF
jgi:uncharacterized protein (TIGR02001 family)